MKLFKEFGIDLENIDNKPLPEYKEWAYDLKKNEFLTRNGAYYLVSKNEALKIWIEKALNTKRYIYEAYTPKFGSELENVIGISFNKEVIKSEIERYIKEALLVNPYIKDVYDFSINIDKSMACVKFNVESLYSSFLYESEILYE